MKGTGNTAYECLEYLARYLRPRSASSISITTARARPLGTDGQRRACGNGSHRQGPAVSDYPRHREYDLVHMQVTVAFAVLLWEATMPVEKCFNNVLISRGLGWGPVYCNRVQCAHISRQHQHRLTKGLSGRHEFAGRSYARQTNNTCRQEGQTRQADGNSVCLCLLLLQDFGGQQK